MAIFYRLMDVMDKAVALREQLLTGGFCLATEHFRAIPGAPFAYWIPEHVRATFGRLPPLSRIALAASGGKTLDDFRFLRSAWEPRAASKSWRGCAKGGAASRYYADVHLLIDWKQEAEALKSYLVDYRESRGWSSNWTAELHGYEHYFRPGLTWPRRTNGLSLRVMPAGCIFGDKGPAVFHETNDPAYILALCALVNSTSFGFLVTLQLARTELAQSYEVGIIQQTPVPELGVADTGTLSHLARAAWSRKRTLDTVNETSHAFALPAALAKLDAAGIEAEIAAIQAEIDDHCFRLYGLDGEDRAEIERWARRGTPAAAEADDEEEDEADSAASDDTLRSWAIGVAFGRFDVRLATGERPPPTEPEPFDPLPARSPGMMADDSLVRPWLVDDPGHPDDLADAVEAVLHRVGQPASGDDLRPWLRRAFFPLHLSMYSKSRRKAPIYWPLATPSGSYTVWIYLHGVSEDTLYKVLSELVEPKLRHEARRLDAAVAELGASTKKADLATVSSQRAFVDELKAFKDEIARVAPLWAPNLDDGVIINFAPLWRLVPHQRPWQTQLTLTWAALRSGEYDWSHLAMRLWPERALPKCATDRSLAIAHDLEAVFWRQDEKEKWQPRAEPTRPVPDLIAERTSPAIKDALQSLESQPAAAAGRGRRRPAG